MREHLSTYLKSCYGFVDGWIDEFGKDPTPPDPIAVRFAYPGWPVVHLTVGLDNIRGEVDSHTPLMNKVLSAPMEKVQEALDEDEELARNTEVKELLRHMFENLYRRMAERRRQTPHMSGIQFSADGTTPISARTIEDPDLQV